MNGHLKTSRDIRIYHLKLIRMIGVQFLGVLLKRTDPNKPLYAIALLINFAKTYNHLYIRQINNWLLLK